MLNGMSSQRRILASMFAKSVQLGSISTVSEGRRRGPRETNYHL